MIRRSTNALMFEKSQRIELISIYVKSPTDSMSALDLSLIDPLLTSGWTTTRDRLITERYTELDWARNSQLLNSMATNGGLYMRLRAFCPSVLLLVLRCAFGQTSSDLAIVHANVVDVRIGSVKTDATVLISGGSPISNAFLPRW